jgi:DNA polymerase III epsilon subunit-like protein
VLAYEISEEAGRVNGHTIESLIEKGRSVEAVIAEIAQDISDSDLIVCHNIGFDLPVLACEMIRAKISTTKKEKFCTMAGSTNVCKIQGPYGFKWPKLQELHKHLFGHEFDGAHDALADILATVRCYFAMRKKYQNTPI